MVKNGTVRACRCGKRKGVMTRSRKAFGGQAKNMYGVKQRRACRGGIKERRLLDGESKEREIDQGIVSGLDANTPVGRRSTPHRLMVSRRNRTLQHAMMARRTAPHLLLHLGPVPDALVVSKRPPRGGGGGVVNVVVGNGQRRERTEIRGPELRRDGRRHARVHDAPGPRRPRRGRPHGRIGGAACRAPAE